VPKSGIVGLPNVGKSTLFNALIKNYAAKAENFAFCTIEPNIGIVEVLDHRLNVLSEIFDSKKTVPSIFEFVDIAGLVKGASEGQGLGNKFLSHIREVDSIVHVLRCFEDQDIEHVENSVDPIRDLETILLELRLADLSVLQKRKEKLKKQIKTKSNQEQKKLSEELEIIEKTSQSLESLQFITLSPKEILLIKHLNLLSFKPFLIVANLKEEELANPQGNSHYQRVLAYLLDLKDKRDLKIPVVPISAQIEADLFDLKPEEAKEYLVDLGIESSGVPKLIKACFDQLDLMYFFTAGEKETKAWTIKKNSTASEAAGEIHTDFQKGFIKAEVVSFEDLATLKSKAVAKEKGKLRLEGKEYLVKDGDIIEFKFNL